MASDGQRLPTPNIRTSGAWPSASKPRKQILRGVTIWRKPQLRSVPPILKPTPTGVENDPLDPEGARVANGQLGEIIEESSKIEVPVKIEVPDPGVAVDNRGNLICTTPDGINIDTTNRARDEPEEARGEPPLSNRVVGRMRVRDQGGFIPLQHAAQAIRQGGPETHGLRIRLQLPEQPNASSVPAPRCPCEPC